MIIGCKVFWSIAVWNGPNCWSISFSLAFQCFPRFFNEYPCTQIFTFLIISLSLISVSEIDETLGIFICNICYVLWNYILMLSLCSFQFSVKGLFHQILTRIKHTKVSIIMYLIENKYFLIIIFVILHFFEHFVIFSSHLFSLLWISCLLPRKSFYKKHSSFPPIHHIWERDSGFWGLNEWWYVKLSKQWVSHSLLNVSYFLNYYY